jgi:hypothetical protein
MSVYLFQKERSWTSKVRKVKRMRTDKNEWEKKEEEYEIKIWGLNYELADLLIRRDRNQEIIREGEK